ncbi:MAG: NTP transferase domain-containing protein [Nocardioidaceae bacterium]
MIIFDAVVLAGGRGVRLGGVDKATLRLGGSTLLGRALTAVGEARLAVVVGASEQALAHIPVTAPPCLAVCEEPRGGGPVAAIAAGLEYVDSSVTVVLACDMPLITARHIRHLCSHVSGSEPGPDGVLYLDKDGRRQPLAAAYQTEALRRALDSIGPPADAAVSKLLERLTMIEVEADAELTLDCDTWSDVERCRALVEDL